MTEISKKKVLVIDDDPDIVKMIRDNLVALEYEVFQAGDGEEGISVARKEIPDVIILDIKMPKKDGFQVFEEMKADKDLMHVPVIILTASSGIDQKVRGYQMGVDGYVVKPYNIFDLITRIKLATQKTK